jgi:CDP-diacylglycerol--serine O-phosphatidyltransferase
MTLTRRRRRRRWLKRISVLPTLMTLANLLCGFTAIVLSIEAGEYARAGDVGVHTDRFVMLMQYASLLILGGMVFDMLDGHVARITKSTSLFGQEMDSLADLVTFGLAPVVIVWQLDTTIWIGKQNVPEGVVPLLGFHARFLWGFLAVYVSCAALRLARYNVETTRAPENTFYGLPSPAAAGAVVSLVLLQFNLQARQSEWVVQTGQFLAAALPFATLGLGLLMITRTYYVHAGKKLLSAKGPMLRIGLVMVVLLVMLYSPEFSLALVFWVYVFSGLVSELRMRLLAPDEIQQRRQRLRGDGVADAQDSQAQPPTGKASEEAENNRQAL